MFINPKYPTNIQNGRQKIKCLENSLESEQAIFLKNPKWPPKFWNVRQKIKCSDKRHTNQIADKIQYCFAVAQVTTEE